MGAWGRHVGWPTQVLLLTARALTDTLRRQRFLLLRAGVTVLQGLLFGLVLLNLKPTTFAGAQSILGFSLSGAAIAGLTSLAAGIALWFSRKPTTLRELKSHAYAPSAYAVSSYLVDAPTAIGFSLLFAAVCYFIPPLPARPAAAAFFFFCLAVAILSGFFAALSHALVALAPAQELAQAGGGVTISLCFLFAGLFIPLAQIPAGWVGLYYAVPTSHVLRAIATSQTFCQGAACPAITLAGAPGSTTISAYVQDYLGLGASTQSPYLFKELGWAALSIAGVLLVAFVRVVACPMR